MADGSVAIDRTSERVMRGEGNRSLIGREPDVLSVEARTAGSGVGFRVERADSEVGEREPLPPADDEARPVGLVGGQAEFRRKVANGHIDGLWHDDQ